MSKSKTVCAVVVTYNRKALLRECLASLLSQTRKVDEIIVINNLSTDGTEVVLEREFPSVVAYNMEENLGGAGGFKAGIRFACEKGFDWIWIMDDDSEPRKNTLELLLEGADNVQRDLGDESLPVAMCPLIWGKTTQSWQNYHHKKIDRYFREEYFDIDDGLPSLVRIDADAFVGPMFNRQGVEKLGLPRDEYFLWVDDLEYTYRFSQAGGCYLVKDAVIDHKDVPGVIAPIKRYYQQRNYMDFVLRRAPLYVSDRSSLGTRRLLAIGARVVDAIRMSKMFCAAAVKGRGVRISESVLPLVGLVHGFAGKSGRR